MASQSLYRRWRSRNFAEIVGQQHVTRTLKNALVQGRMSHAYLFCGPRGIGKTSAARVLAKAANCENLRDGEPCGSCRPCTTISEGRCLDVIEIDAASNRGIDDVRELRDKINFAPSEVRYKFYILDEVHMLSNEAFNALLKTLEEPPPHAVFVLVTTESHKLPATVLSRCQRFDFRRINLPDLIDRLKQVCVGEGLEVETDAVELIARLSTGSLRDAESLLDQLVSYCGNKITLEDVRMVVGMTESESARKLVGHLFEGDIPSGLRLISDVAGGGADLRQFAREVVEYLRNLMLVKVGGGDLELESLPKEILAEMNVLAGRISPVQIVQSIRLFGAVESGQRTYSHSQLPLELAFVEAVLQGDKGFGEHAASPVADSSGAAAQQIPNRQPSGDRLPSDRPLARHSVKAAASHPVGHARLEAPGPLRVDVPQVASPSDTKKDLQSASDRDLPVAKGVSDLVREWSSVVAALGSIDKRIQALVRACRPIDVEGDTVVLGFFYKFHRDAIDEQSNRALVEKVLSEVRGTPSRVRCVVSPREKGAAHSPVDDPLVRAAVSMGARIKKVETHLEK